MLSRTFRQTLIKSRMAAMRGGHGPAPLAPNGLADNIKHDNGLPEHHHHAVHSAPLDHTFIASGVNKKTMIFDGLHGKDNQIVAIDNQFHQLNGLSMFQ